MEKGPAPTKENKSSLSQKHTSFCISLFYVIVFTLPLPTNPTLSLVFFSFEPPSYSTPLFKNDLCVVNWKGTNTSTKKTNTSLSLSVSISKPYILPCVVLLCNCFYPFTPYKLGLVFFLIRNPMLFKSFSKNNFCVGNEKRPSPAQRKQISPSLPVSILKPYTLPYICVGNEKGTSTSTKKKNPSLYLSLRWNHTRFHISIFYVIVFTLPLPPPPP